MLVDGSSVCHLTVAIAPSSMRISGVTWTELITGSCMSMAASASFIPGGSSSMYVAVMVSL